MFITKSNNNSIQSNLRQNIFIHPKCDFLIRTKCIFLHCGCVYVLPLDVYTANSKLLLLHEDKNSHQPDFSLSL